jgi:hypothetical protein
MIRLVGRIIYLPGNTGWRGGGMDRDKMWNAFTETDAAKVMGAFLYYPCYDFSI